MNDPIIVDTKIGPMAVLIFDNRATVRGGNYAERVQVGKFEYRVNLYFVRDQDGTWREGDWKNQSVYRADMAKYFQDPAPTIKSKIVLAAEEALAKALQDNPLALLTAAADEARQRWVSAKSKLESLQTQLELAQQECNKAEKEYYAAEDREVDAINALAEETGQS